MIEKNSERIAWMRQQLTTALRPSQLEIKDESAKHIGHEGAKSGAGHFAITISSPSFQNKSLIECHRMIYDALKGSFETEIHALRIKILGSS